MGLRSDGRARGDLPLRSACMKSKTFGQARAREVLWVRQDGETRLYSRE
jgi:hypothetical protein